MILDPVRREVVRLLAEEVSPGRTRADVAAGVLVDAAIGGNVDAARLVIEILGEYDPILDASARAAEGDDE